MGLASWPLPAAWATSYGIVFALIAASITATCCLSFLSHTSFSLLLACLLLYCAAELGFALLVRTCAACVLLFCLYGIASRLVELQKTPPGECVASH